MIKFSLQCYNGHEFDSWFLDSESYAKLQEKKLVACPTCGICEVTKAITAPNILRKSSEAMHDPRLSARETLRELTELIKSQAENVGDQFPEEARRIHNGECDVRSIYGQATLEQAIDLRDEGIEIHVLPEMSSDA